MLLIIGASHGDNGNVNSDYVTKSGGNWSNDSAAGMFYVNVNNDGSTNSNIGSHLVNSVHKDYKNLFLYNYPCLY